MPASEEQIRSIEERIRKMQERAMTQSGSVNGARANATALPAPDTSLSSVSAAETAPDSVRGTVTDIERRLRSQAQTPKTADVQRETQEDQLSSYEPVFGGVLGGLERAGDFFMGVGQQAVRTVAGASELGERGLRAATGALGVPQPEAEPLGQSVQEAFRPQTREQAAGQTAAEIASYMAPIPGLRAARGAAAAGTASRLGSGLLGGTTRLAGRAGAEAAEFAGRAATIEGETEGIGREAAIGAAIPVAGAALRGVTRGVGRAGREALAKTTGTTEEVIKTAFDNSSVVRFARRAGAEGVEDIKREALEEAGNGLNAIKRTRANQYTRQLNKLKTKPRDLQGIIDDTRDAARNIVRENDIKLGPGKKLNNLDFSTSTITDAGAQRNVQQAINDVMSWTDTSLAGIDKLKRRLNDYVSNTRLDRPAQRLIVDLKNNVRSGLNKSVKGYEKMTSQYREFSKLIEEVQKSLSLTDKATTEQTLRKIMNVFGRNNEARRELLKQVSGAAGEDIEARVAGSLLSPTAPRSIAGTVSPIGSIGAFSVGNVPGLILYLSASSPRLVAEFMNILRQVTTPMIRSGQFSPEIRRSIQGLIQQAEQEQRENRP